MSKCSPTRPPPSSGLVSRAVDHAVSRLLAHERIRAARHHIERTDEVTLARQAALSAIPAPTGAEGRRGAHLAELFREIGLSDVSIDHAGNVHGWLGKNGRREAGEVGGPVVLAAHLDTVFGAEVDVAVERRGQRLEGPGISDNARGLAALVAVAAAFGVANPANAVGRAVALLADLPTQQAPRTTCAVVRLGGGTGLNSIPQEAWLDLDLRSEDPRALSQLDVTVRAALERAADDENRRRTATSPPLRVEIRLLGDRPSGMTPRAHPLVQAAVAANRALGRDAELASASTDANVPIALGIPAIALGAGGKAGDAHLATEWFENVEGALGIIRALLVTAAMAEVE